MREYENVLLIDVTPEQLESVLVELDSSTPMGQEIARRVRGGELHLTMTPEGLTPTTSGLATAKEIHVQWKGSVQETASTLVHEGVHQADPALAEPGAGRTEVEANARIHEYEYRAQKGLPAYDFAEQMYRDVLADVRARGLPEAEALANARGAMIDAMQTDPARYGVEKPGGARAVRGPAAAPGLPPPSQWPTRCGYVPDGSGHRPRRRDPPVPGRRARLA